jgi:PPOX class probable F420-dependent enzyme
MATDLLALGGEPFVSRTTFRRSGEPVATPVWVAPENGTLVVITGDGSGEVTRLRRDPRVVLGLVGRLGSLLGRPAPDRVILRLGA